MKQFLFLSTALFITSLSFSQPGTVDLSFGSNGFVYTKTLSVNYAVVQQPDGKLLTAGGYSDNKGNPVGDIARYLPDGTLDSSFGTNGFAGYPPGGGGSDIILQADGKIVTIGSHLSRLKSDGSLDSSFGKNGIAFIPDYGDGGVYDKIRQEPDGSYIIAGYGQPDPYAIIPAYMILSRIFADGFFDYHLR